MIILNKLKLFPFKTKIIGLESLKGLANYNVVFYPENTDFIDSYHLLNIQKRFVRKATIIPNKIPRLIADSKTFIQSFKGTGLIPIRKITDITGNMFIDTTPFFRTLEKKFGAGSYRRPFMFGRVLNYCQTIKESFPTRKNVLLYFLDSSKEFPDSLVTRRIFPVIYYMYRNKAVPFFDYILFANKTMDGNVVYSLLSNPDQSVTISRIWSLFKSLQSPTVEEQDEYKEEVTEEATKKIVELSQTEHDTILTKEKTEQVVKEYLQDEHVSVSEKALVKDEHSVPIVATSIISGFSGDKNKAIEYMSKVEPQEVPVLLRRLKEDILPEIVSANTYKNKSRDLIFKDIKIQEINNNKEPSKIINKRKSDFETTFEKDLKNSFGI